MLIPRYKKFLGRSSKISAKKNLPKRLPTGLEVKKIGNVFSSSIGFTFLKK